MSRYWRKAKVDLTQADIVSALRSHGDSVYLIGQPVDLLVRTRSIWWTCETKTPGKNEKRRQQTQLDHEADCVANSAPHFTVKSVAEVLHARNIVLNAEAP